MDLTDKIVDDDDDEEGEKKEEKEEEIVEVVVVLGRLNRDMFPCVIFCNLLVKGRGWQTFSVKGHTVNMLDFVGHITSVTTTQL